MTDRVWADGRLLDVGEAVVGATDRGVTVGLGVFETCAIVAGQPFALTRHLRRLGRSAALVGLPVPDGERLREGIAVAVAAAGTEAARVRITVLAGPAGAAGPSGPRTTVLVAAGPAPDRGAARAVRVPWVRNERSAVTGAKTTSYAENAVALAAAERRGANEALLANSRGDLCEGTGSNVFVDRGGELLTPPESSGCLAGVTRELVLEWAQEAGLPVREARDGELRYEVLDAVAAGECGLLLTGSLRGVVPVVALDDVPLSASHLGGRVAREFARRAALDIDP